MAHKLFTREQAVAVAHEWASVNDACDPGICMYAFASTGRVQSPEHRTELKQYIEADCIWLAQHYCKANEKSIVELRRLERYIQQAPLERN